MKNLYEVEVFHGSGGDTDNVATYLVYAKDEVEAEETALATVDINAKANLIRFRDKVDELDYDGVLGE